LGTGLGWVGLDKAGVKAWGNIGFPRRFGIWVMFPLLANLIACEHGMVIISKLVLEYYYYLYTLIYIRYSIDVKEYINIV